VDSDVAAAVALLRSARQPLVYGLADSTVEAQRAAVSLAARVGAIVDTPASSSAAGALSAFQHRGAQSASQGELARADLCVAWACAPERPVHVAVDVGTAHGPRAADTRLVLRADQELGALLVLRAFVRGRRVEPERAGDLPVDALRSLARRLTSARYPVVFAEGDRPGERRDAELDDALAVLVRECHKATRARLVRLRVGANPVGAENVLAWRTGAPSSVRFAPGGPVYGPDEFSAEALLRRGDVDLVVLVGDRGDALSETARAALRRLPRIEIGPRPGPEARVAFVTAPFDATPGYAFRDDGVVRRLAPVAAKDPITECQVLARLVAAVAGEARA
jgi:formylmethanofuran dehydrogenase subunit B